MVLPCLMGVFNSIGGGCFGWIGERISAEAAHLISYGENIDILRSQVQDLTDAIKSVEDRIREAESSRGATLVDAVVERLLERMATLREEASKIIIAEERSLDCTCIIRLRPNLWACYVTSKSAKKAIDEAVGLLEKEKKFDRAVSVVDHLNCLGVTPNPDFEELESRVLAFNQIVEALKDPNVHKVGVYGMGGTGKTTLAVKIGADLQLNGTFNYVVLATVSEKQSLLQSNYQSDLTSIQKQIAEGLKIQLEGETLNARATQLRDQLQKKNKLLIILDDIWSKFELEMVGIPVGISFTSKFKILMTSRSKVVLENEMDSKKNFKLDSLSIDDAHNLFDKMIGGDAQYSKWPLVARQVVDLCGGVPILLVTIGRALRNATRSIWEDALTQLKRFDGEDIDEEGYKKIEVSYKFLKNEEIKKLFLLCAQLDHRSIEFESLLKYAMGLDLFKGRETVKEVSGRLHKYLRDLKGCCLLQDGSEEGIIKMHDVVYKFATFVASRDHHVFSVANDGELKRWPSKKEFEKFRTISFFYCHLPSYRELPVTFVNPDLESFLMLQSEFDAFFQIPDNFFMGMKGLKLMELTNMSLSPVLVSSLGGLVMLRTLCLDGCELSDITVIGELSMLQALSLRGSSITLVPKEIGELGDSLKLLDLRGCELESIASGVISKLTLLEDLRIGDSFSTWQRLRGGGKSRHNVDEIDEAKVASLEEFKNLQNLINLEIRIHGAKLFPKDLVFKKLETFEICFASRDESMSMSSDYISTRTLLVNESSTVVEFHSEGSRALMTTAECLLLERVSSSVTVCEMDLKGFSELKHLEVKYGDGIQYIIKKNYRNCIFPKLETLNLSELFKLEMICDDHDHPLPIGSFENLSVINVRRCDLLNNIFSSNFAIGLLRLREMRVENCKNMESIVVSRKNENEAEIKLEFTHQLRVLKLSRLPHLLSFYNFKQVEELPSPTTLFHKKIMFPKLEVLELIHMKIEKIWDDHIAIAAEGICSFQNLTSLKVNECHNLSYLFTSSMVKSFTQLQELTIDDCDSIEEIVATNEGQKDGEKLSLFPKLERLRLQDLPKLKRFCDAHFLEYQSLQMLNIWECPLLELFIGLFDENIMIPKLEELYLGWMKNEKIWDDHVAIIAEGACWFQNLTRLDVIGCGDLSYLFTYSTVKSLAQLKNIRVSHCHSIEEIVVSSTEREPAGDTQLSFPKLENLELGDLPKLKSFCHANLLECQLLRQLSMEDCSNLNTFMITNDYSGSDNSTTLFNEKVAFPNMEKLEIYGLGNFKMICGNQLDPNSFSKLKILRISRVGDLLNVFTLSDPYRR